MDDPIKRVETFVEQENCFVVMGNLRKLGVLTENDIKMALGMTRDGWLRFMKEKAGILAPQNETEEKRDGQ